MKDNLPPRKYAEQVLGKAASSEQLDLLFELLPEAHPVVVHGRGVMTVLGVGHRIRNWTEVIILDHRPASAAPPDPRAEAGVRARSSAVCNEDAGDQPSRRLGVTIAFGRALKNLRVKSEYAEAALSA